mmetsp:Transcript_899/g.2023  ORF Transcript_899/g.2023 Transcript_899/m.2023 type:complete len:344 (-) Transcript_899:824-1855(-)
MSIQQQWQLQQQKLQDQQGQEQYIYEQLRYSNASTPVSSMAASRQLLIDQLKFQQQFQQQQQMQLQQQQQLLSQQQKCFPQVVQYPQPHQQFANTLQRQPGQQILPPPEPAPVLGPGCAQFLSTDNNDASNSKPTRVNNSNSEHSTLQDSGGKRHYENHQVTDSDHASGDNNSERVVPFSQAFREILQEIDSKDFTDGNPSRTWSPIPLAPEVELRHNRVNASLSKAQIALTGEEHNQEDSSKMRGIHTASISVSENGRCSNKTGCAEQSGSKVERRKKRKEEETSKDGGKTEVVEIGFFSSLLERGLYSEVLGVTGVKKRQRRRRKPKRDLLEGVSMGFFSG